MGTEALHSAAATAVAVPSRARIGLAVILFVTLMVSYLDRVNVSVLAADAKFLADMGITGQPVQIGLLMTVFLFAYGISNIVTGPIGDYLGPRKAMTLSILLWAVSMLIGGFASAFATMLAARIVLGVGEGMHWPMQSAFVKNWFPPGERVKANSAWIVGIMVGPAVSIPLFVAVVGGWDWRATFYFLVVVSAVPLVLVWFFTTDLPADSPRVNAAELAHIEAGLKAEREAFAARVAAAGAAAGSRRSFLGDYQYWLITLAFTASASVFWGTMAWLPSYLKTVRGFSWAQMGSLSSLPYIIGVVTVVACAVIADRTPRKAVFPLIALTGAAVSIYVGANVTDNITSAYWLSAAIGFLGIGLPCYWAVMQSLVAPSAIGSAAGLMNGVASIASSFAPTIIGALIQLSGGSYVSGLLYLVSVGALGAVCMLVLTVKRV